MHYLEHVNFQSSTLLTIQPCPQGWRQNRLLHPLCCVLTGRGYTHACRILPQVKDLAGVETGGRGSGVETLLEQETQDEAGKKSERKPWAWTVCQRTLEKIAAVDGALPNTHAYRSEHPLQSERTAENENRSRKPEVHVVTTASGGTCRGGCVIEVGGAGNEISRCCQTRMIHWLQLARLPKEYPAKQVASWYTQASPSWKWWRLLVRWTLPQSTACPISSSTAFSNPSK